MGAATFDAVAATYDAQFTETRLGRLLRQAVWETCAPYFQAGMRVLEVGAGTGEDAAWLGRRGIRVVATDASLAMVGLARAKAERHGLADRVAHYPFAAEELPSAGLEGPFDGVFSNFGALNCVEDLPAFAAWLAGQVRPGGRLVVVVMGPHCPWEILWHLGHGRPRTALRRLRRGGVVARIAGGPPFRVQYPTAASLARTFAPAFRVLAARGLGVFLPTTEAGHLVDRWPALFEALAGCERAIAHRFPFRALADHYVLVLERSSP
jgi:SAM-dependent methyltransferase